MDRLVLFDIDGTLLSSGGAGGSSLLFALREVFRRDFSHEGYTMSGKTDTQICLELMSSAGLMETEVLERLPRVWESYVSEMAVRLSNGFEAKLYPGVREVVNRLHDDPRTLLGLLTGNIRAGASVKLDAVGLDGFFEFGAFGDDHPDRCVLAEIAVQRGGEIAGRTFIGEEVVVVGDTPNDIRCARHIGARTVIVATGNYDIQQLEERGADHLFETLENTDMVLEAISG